MERQVPRNLQTLIGILQTHGFVTVDSVATEGDLLVGKGKRSLGVLHPPRPPYESYVLTAVNNHPLGMGMTWGPVDAGSISFFGRTPDGYLLLKPEGEELHCAADLIPWTVTGPTSNFDLGMADKMWREAFISQLNATVFSTNTQRIEAGLFTVGHDAGTIKIKIDPSNTTADFGKTMTKGDFVLFKGVNKSGTPQTEYMLIGDQLTGNAYYISDIGGHGGDRDLDGSGANTWPLDSPFLVLGQSGDPRIDMIATGTGSPQLSMKTQGATYNTSIEYTRVGNLRDSYGVGAADTYGVGIGRDETGYNYLSITAAGGLQFYNNADTVVGQLTGTEWTLGATGAERLKVTSSAVQMLDVSDNVQLELTNTPSIIIGDDDASPASYISISASGIDIFSEGIQTIDMDASGTLTLGDTDNEHIILDPTYLQFNDTLGNQQVKLSGDTPATLVLGPPGTEHVEITSTSIQFIDNATVYGELTGTVWTLGQENSEKIVITATAVQFQDYDDTVRLEMTATPSLILGDNDAASYVTITDSVIAMFSNSVQTVELDASGELTLGYVGTENVQITSSAMNFRDATNIRGSLSADLWTLGLLGANHRVTISPTAVTFIDNGTDTGQLTSAAWRIGTAAGYNTKIGAAYVGLYNSTTSFLYLDSSGVRVGRSGAYHQIQIATDALTFYDGGVSYGSLTSDKWTIGRTGAYHQITIEDTALTFLDGGVNYGQLTSDTWTIGRTGSYHQITITDTALTFKDSGTTYGSLTGTTWILGIASGDQIRITSSSFQILDQGDVWTALTAGQLTLGDVVTNKDYIKISSTGIDFYSNAVVMIAIDTAEGLIIGDDDNYEYLHLSSSGVAFKDGSTTLGTLTSTAWTLGQVDADLENLYITSTAVQFRENEVVMGQLTAGAWTLGEVDTGLYNLYMTNSTIQFRAGTNGTDVLGSLSSSEWVLGKVETDIYNIKLTSTALQFRAGTNGEEVLGELTAKVWTLGDLTINPGTGYIGPSPTYSFDFGDYNAKFKTIYASELWVQTLVAQDILSTVGGRIMVTPTTVLTSAINSSVTTITLKHNNLTPGDTVVMQSAPGATPTPQTEFMLIKTGPTVNGDYYNYTVERGLDGAANSWDAGDAVANTQYAGEGFIDLYSAGGVIPGSTVGPTIVGNVRDTTTELCLNPGFETVSGGPDWANWSETVGDGTLTDETSLVNSGSHAAKMTSGATSNTYLSQTRTVTAETNYRFTFFTRGDGTYAGEYRVKDVTNGNDIIARVTTGVTGTVYTQVLVAFKTPALCVLVNIYLFCPSTNGGIAYFDDVTLQEIPAFDAYSEHWAIGNLNDLYGQSTNVYGVGLGRYASGSNHLLIDDTNGIRFYEGTSTLIAQWDGTTITLGQTGSNHRVEITPTSVLIYDNGTVFTEISSAAITLGDDGAGDADYMTLSNTGIKMYSHADLVVDITSTTTPTVTIGKSGAFHRVSISPTALTFYDGGTDYGQLTGTSWRMGISGGNQVLIKTTGIEFYEGTTEKQTADFQTDGDIFIGSDVSAVGTTYFTLFANAQGSYEAGDLIIGSYGTSDPNMFWDESTGQLNFRGGEADPEVWINTTGQVVAGGGDVTIDSTGVNIAGAADYLNFQTASILKGYIGLTDVGDYESIRIMRGEFTLTNLLTNYDFEIDVTTGWEEVAGETSWSVSQSGAYTRPGSTKHLRLAISVGSGIGQYRTTDFMTIGGDYCRFSGWIYLDQVEDSSAYLGTRILWYNSSNGLIGSNTAHRMNHDEDEWFYFEQTWVKPTGGVKVKVAFYTSGGTGGPAMNVFYLDDLSVSSVGSSLSYIDVMVDPMGVNSPLIQLVSSEINVLGDEETALLSIGDGTEDATVFIDGGTDSRLGIGVNPSYPLHIQETSTPQFRLAYDASNYATFSVSSTGVLTIDTLPLSPISGAKIDLSDLAGDNITWDATNFQFDASSGGVVGANAGAGLVWNDPALNVVSGNTAIVVNADDITLTLATNSGLTIATGLKINRADDTAWQDFAGTNITWNSTNNQFDASGGVSGSDAGDGLTYDTDLDVTLATNSGLVVSADALNMGAPTTIDLTTSDSVTTSTHAHAITTSSSPTDAQILQSDSSGYLQLVRLGLGIAPTTYPFRILSSTHPQIFIEYADTYWGLLDVQSDGDMRIDCLKDLTLTPNGDIHLLPGAGGDVELYGKLSIGDAAQFTPSYALHVISTTSPQFRLEHTASTYYADFSVSGTGSLTIASVANLTFDPTGGTVNIDGDIEFSADKTIGGTTGLTISPDGVLNITPGDAETYITGEFYIKYDASNWIGVTVSAAGVVSLTHSTGGYLDLSSFAGDNVTWDATNHEFDVVAPGAVSGDAGDGLTYDTNLDVTLATNSGLVVSADALNMGTPTTLTSSTTDSVTTNTHAHALNLSGFAGDGLVWNVSVLDVDVTDLIGAGLVEIATNNIGLADSVAGAGIGIDGSKILSIATGNTGITIDTNGITLLLNATASGLSISTGLMINDTIAGSGLSISSKVLAIDRADDAAWQDFAGANITWNSTNNQFDGSSGSGSDFTTQVTITTTSVPQLQLLYNGTYYADFSVGSSGHLTIAPVGDLLFTPTGGDVQITGELGIGVLPTAPLHVLSATSPQFKVEYSAGNYFSAAVNGGGDVAFVSSGGNFDLTGTLDVSDVSVPQFRIYSTAEYASFSLDASGNLDIDTTGAGISILDGLRVGDATTPTDNDIRTVGDFAAGGGMLLGGVGDDPGGIRLIIDQAAEAGEIITLRSSSVAHGVTTLTATDTYGYVKRFGFQTGGLQIYGLTESTVGLSMAGVAPTAVTTKTTASLAAVVIDAIGVNGDEPTTVGANGNLLVIRNYTGTRFIVDEDGDFYYYGTSNAFDNYIDAQLVRVLDVSFGGPGLVDGQFDEFLEYGRDDLQQLGIVSYNDDGHHFINGARLQRLHNGAIWQNYNNHLTLREQVDQLSKRVNVYGQALLDAGISIPQLEA